MKSFFPLLQNNPDVVYLDAAATTPMCQAAIDAMNAFVNSSYGPVHRVQHSLGVKATQQYEQARETIAKVCGVQANSCIITKGTTDGLNIAISGCEHLLNEGDEIITSVAEHHSLFVPLQQLAKRTGAKLHVLDVNVSDDDLEGALDYAKFKDLLNANTKIVALHNISNVLGNYVHIDLLHEEMIKKGIRDNVLLLIDGAQGFPFRFSKNNPGNFDVYCCSAHKLYGPTGVGLMLLSDRAKSKLQPTRFGGAMVDVVTQENTTFADLPMRLEPGTPPVAEAIGFAAALTWLQEIDEQVKQNNQIFPGISEFQELADFLTEHATVYNKQDRTLFSSIISFNVEGVNAYDVAALLDDKGIAVRSGHMCAQPLMNRLGVTSVVRASTGIYTTENDVTAFKKAFAEVKTILEKHKH